MKPVEMFTLSLFTVLLLGLTAASEGALAAGTFDYAIIHYNRTAGDYGDHNTGNFNDFWGLHLWGDGIDPSEVSNWTEPKPFLGEDEYGRFAWIKRGGSGNQVNFIIHKGDVKDTDFDRGFDADTTPEIWINTGDVTIYNSQADAQGFTTVRYHRDDGDYGDSSSPDFNDFWGLHLWGNAIDPSEATGWTSPKPPTGIDEYGVFWEVLIVDSSQPVNFIIHRGDLKDPGPDESFIPEEIPTAWKQSGDTAIYPSRGAAEDFAIIHYHRDDGDYGNPASRDFNDFWGAHIWTGALNPTQWQNPVRWDHLDVFGAAFELGLVDGARLLAYILHRGDIKDPGPDQFLEFEEWGYEVWQLSGADPEKPYVYPIRGVPVLSTPGPRFDTQPALTAIVSPNPIASHGVFTLSLAQADRLSLRIFDVQGRLVQDLLNQQPFSAGVHRVALDNRMLRTLRGGTYFYQVQGMDTAVSGKLLLLP